MSKEFKYLESRINRSIKKFNKVGLSSDKLISAFKTIREKYGDEATAILWQIVSSSDVTTLANTVPGEWSHWNTKPICKTTHRWFNLLENKCEKLNIGIKCVMKFNNNWNVPGGYLKESTREHQFLIKYPKN